MDAYEFIKCSSLGEAWILYLLLKRDPEYTNVRLLQGTNVPVVSFRYASKDPGAHLSHGYKEMVKTNEFKRAEEFFKFLNEGSRESPAIDGG